MEKLDAPGKAPTFEQLYIDIGISNNQEAPLRVGDIAVFDRSFLDLENRLVAKAMDDRIGVAVLIETLRKLSATREQIHAQVQFVFSVQEEVGTRGATAAAYGLDPDLGLAVDVCLSGDTPRGYKMEVGLGKGPAIKVRDGSMLSDSRVIEWMVNTAQVAGLPFQLEVMDVGGTDARAIQLTRAGVPSGCLSIPCRYVHSPSEMVDYRDVQGAVGLLVELLTHPIPFTRQA
jgi:endoglucanase